MKTFWYQSIKTVEKVGQDQYVLVLNFNLDNAQAFHNFKVCPTTVPMFPLVSLVSRGAGKPPLKLTFVNMSSKKFAILVCPHS